MTESTAITGAANKAMPSETEMLRSDIARTVALILEVADVGIERAYKGGQLGADMLMKLLQERGWRPEEGWE